MVLRAVLSMLPLTMAQRLFFLTLFISGSLMAQSAGISGVVLDGRSRKPVAGVRLVIQSGAYTACTDSEGRFALELHTSSGSVACEFFHEDYISRRFSGLIVNPLLDMGVVVGNNQGPDSTVFMG